MRYLTRGGAVAIVGAMLAGGPVHAQSPVGADTLSPAAIAESLAVLKTLDGTVSANRNDAAAWYRIGMVAWALRIRAGVEPAAKNLDRIRMTRMADTSFRIAAQIEPKNPRYLIAAGALLVEVGDVSSRAAAIGFTTAAARAAREQPDQNVHAATALAAGRVYWLQYDTEANGRKYLYFKDVSPGFGSEALQNAECPQPLAQSIDQAISDAPPPDLGGIAKVPQRFAAGTLGALGLLHSLLSGCTQSIPGAGDVNYSLAEELFREAMSAAPTDAHVFRHLAMLLAEKRRWGELESIARTRVALVREDPNGWLVLGLALHRGGQRERAGAAFDSAIAHLSAPERGRLFSFTRLLTRKDSVAYASATTEARQRTERSFWAMADPLWSRPGDEPRTEFLARVAFAELRWTVEELSVRGADSDRGEIHIRYGPPDSIAVLRGNDFLTAASDQRGSAFAHSSGGAPVGAPTANPSAAPGPSVITYWDYDNGLFVVFWGAPMYGTARFPYGDAVRVEELVQLRPMSFDNIAQGQIDDMPMRSARFRTASDSIDLVVLTKAPMEMIHEGSAENAPVREHAWLIGSDASDAHHDTLTVDSSGVRAWTYRVRSSVYMYRVEATADGAQNAGRGTLWIAAANDTITGFTTRGFGMSDLLLTSRTQARVTPAVRWRDFDIAPILGDVAKKGSIDFIWENYEFGQRDGQSRYQITVTVDRQRSAAGRIAAEIVGAVAGSVGVKRTDDRLTLQFDHTAPYAPAFADHITVALGETPAGTYRATLEILDRVTGRKTSRATTIAIRE